MCFSSTSFLKPSSLIAIIFYTRGSYRYETNAVPADGLGDPAPADRVLKPVPTHPAPLGLSITPLHKIGACATIAQDHAIDLVIHGKNRTNEKTCVRGSKERPALRNLAMKPCLGRLDISLVR
jgi:hypothetical protein